MHTSKFFVALFLLVFCLSNRVSSQLVNIESQRMQSDSVRFALKSDLLFNYSDNNGNYIIQIGSNITAQLKAKDLKKTYFFIGNYNLIRSKDEEFQNSWFLHVRYNQKLSKLFRLEAFLQNQNNTRLTITSRNLIGAGIRLKFISTETGKAYFGNSYMYEIEQIKEPKQQFYNHRNSSYLSLSQHFKRTKLDLVGTVYFQPLYNNIANHRVLAQLKAELPLGKRLRFSALYNYFYASFPENDTSDYSSNLQLGLTFQI
ncbi:DUF481 domain-containing protein [Aggregatimonas sangjinii]|uniref:DUF481 domain-containing protein n=1 Tax=Aggregatimonas sangjinii TaxID=2583587 RepID=A0A5B7SSQ4_9FLAO|nr:DUF481 domain-containing protein [Aggregatimonas sangjinii]QCX00038.1 DUF481 domain-containing protein [Aggregatimonas sangjinii]